MDIRCGDRIEFNIPLRFQVDQKSVRKVRSVSEKYGFVEVLFSGCPYYQIRFSEISRHIPQGDRA